MGQDKGKGRRPRFVRIERGKTGRAGGETAPEREPQEGAQEGPPTPEERDLHTRIVVPRQARGAPPKGTRAEVDIELREVRYGSTSRMPYLRVVPRQKMFTRVAPGELEATALASRPQDIVGRYLADLKRVVIGSPFATSQAIHERLSKVKALAVLGSDPLSSSAYATEEMLIILMLAGSGALRNGLPIAGVIALLLLIVSLSYRQTIRAYPSGGGAYAVSQDNLGRGPSLLAASALLVDYVLLVSVSVAAGVAAITSAVPDLYAARVPIGVAAVGLLTVGNLRGIRESGTLFAAPTYFFIVAMATMIFIGMVKVLVGDAPGSLLHGAPPREQVAATQGLTLFLVLRAFSSGSAALTGVEAMSNGVPTFKRPESTNARTTLTVMLAIAVFLFLGITYLSSRFGVIPTEDETLVSALGRVTFGDNVLYYAYQVATAMVLFLAANTSFNAFPLLGAILARDRFLPRQFTYKGDRLAFSNGILFLAGAAALLLVVFEADVSNLIPLYAVGVFVSFTLSQSGMVRHWLGLKGSGWRTSLVINGTGAAVTGVVAVIIAATKFMHGAWISILMMLALMLLFTLIRRHYEGFEKEVLVEEGALLAGVPRAVPTEAVSGREHVVVPVQDISKVSAAVIGFARELCSRVTAVYMSDDREEAERFRARWEEAAPDVRLLVIESPYRAFVAPMLAYVESLRRAEPDVRVTVVLPRIVLRHWWQRFLHNQNALGLRRYLKRRPRVRVVDFPFRMAERQAAVG
jgi:amino acid transporter